MGGQAKVQYVWSPVYVDALILRDRDSDGDGTLDERLWVVQDANYNVTALLDDSGEVVERYIYDPFGQATVLDAEWNVRSAGSAYDWLYLHQGGRYDVTSGLYHFRHRDYSPTLGRWTSLDPLRYAAGDVNLYRSVGNNPLNSLDPSGLDDDIPLPDTVAVPLPNPRLPLLSPPSPPPSWFDRLFDEFQMIGTFVVNSPGEAAWEYYTGLAYGAYGVFIEPVVNTGEAILDVGGFILIDDYEPLNPHLRGMLNGERTWYGGTVSLVVDGLVVVPVVRGGQQVVRLGGSAAYKWLSVRAYRTIESEVSALQASAASIRAQWIQHEQEAEALWRLIELTGQVPKSHFLGRHSPSVSMDALRDEQYMASSLG
ncbi:MAG: hypothetical protein KatS3mg107_1227 [Gemmataceae bacterium]|nr:MAG: hypothetical protein KatS3mg107_1227 [Gemmataceae bacterium]